MPWIGSKIGRAICDGCYAASKDAHFTGRNDLKVIGAYLPRGYCSEVIYCPICIMTNDKAWGGKASLDMDWDKANELFRTHWYTPEKALELEYTTGMVPGEARPEPPETPVGQLDENHPSQQVPPVMFQGEASTPALAIQDVSGRIEQLPSAEMVQDLTAAVNSLKAEVHELKEQLKQHQQLIETFQNEVRTLKEQVSGQPSQSSSVPAKMIHVHR